MNVQGIRSLYGLKAIKKLEIQRKYLEEGNVEIKEDGDKEVPEEVKYTDGQAVKDLCEPGETCHLYAIWKKSDGSFEMKNIIHDDKMFLGDVNLTGQNGTGYSNANIDSKSAHIDKEDDPGYFTDRYGSNNN